jgi:hypothetical protein
MAPQTKPIAHWLLITNISEAAGEPIYASQRCFESILKHILAVQRDFSRERSKKEFTKGRNLPLPTHCHDMLRKFESLPHYPANSSESVQCLFAFNWLLDSRYCHDMVHAYCQNMAKIARTYPNRPAARYVIKAQARWSRAK